MANLSLKNVPQVIVDSQVWKSIFRHGYAMNRRNRLLAITNNVFYHILPTKISRYGMRMAFPLGRRHYYVLSVLDPDVYGRPVDVLLRSNRSPCLL